MVRRTVQTDIEKGIGALVRARRLAVGMTQENLGERIDVSYQQIQKYEAGANRISVSRLIQIAAALGTTAAEMVGEIERKQTD